MSGLDDFSTQQFLQDQASQRSAQIAKSFTYKGFTVRKEVIDLTNGYGPGVGLAPYAINYPFRGVFVRSASDSTTYATLALNDDSQINVQNGLDLYNNDQFRLPGLVAKGAIVAPAQSGKSITLYFIVDGDFVSGSQVSQVAGGVNITTGTGMTPQACKTVAASGGAATQILAADTSRKKATITNLSGAVLYLSGTNTVAVASGAVAGTTLVGIPIPVGSSFEWQNTGAIYGLGDGGTCLVAINTET